MGHCVARSVGIPIDFNCKNFSILFLACHELNIPSSVQVGSTGFNLYNRLIIKNLEINTDLGIDPNRFFLKFQICVRRSSRKGIDVDITYPLSHTVAACRKPLLGKSVRLCEWRSLKGITLHPKNFSKLVIKNWTSHL